MLGVEALLSDNSALRQSVLVEKLVRDMAAWEVALGEVDDNTRGSA